MISDKWFELLEMAACTWNEYSVFVLRGIMLKSNSFFVFRQVWAQ